MLWAAMSSRLPWPHSKRTSRSPPRRNARRPSSLVCVPPARRSTESADQPPRAAPWRRAAAQGAVPKLPRLGVAEARPAAWLIVGINGAGKTTFYEEFLRPRLSAEFVNADEIARARWGELAPAHAYEAGRLAEMRRRELIGQRASLVAETVFSHPSKLDLVRDL